MTHRPPPGAGEQSAGTGAQESTRAQRLATAIGVALAVILVAVGLATLGGFVLAVVGVSLWGSNK